MIRLSARAATAKIKTPESAAQVQKNVRLERAAAYLHAQEAVMQGNATASDVDRLMQFYTPDYVYRDARVGITVSGIEKVRHGSASHLGESRDASMQIEDAISVGNAVALKVRTSFTLTQTGEHVDRTNLVLLRFAGARIEERTDY